MSRMTKFLKQYCQVEAYACDEENNPERNRFGEIVYLNPIKCKCRHEKIVKDVQVSNGSIIQSTSRYFIDDKVELFVNYKVDGNVIITLEEYINEFGKKEGYEVYV